MIAEVLFILGLVNNFFLIVIFSVRQKISLKQLEKLGKYYFIVTIPVIIALILAFTEEKASFYMIFLIIFLIYLGIEALYDFILKLDWRTNWKLAVPYLAFYYMMNYGMIVMNSKENVVSGGIMIALFVIQIIVNTVSHPKKNKTEPPASESKPEPESVRDFDTK